MVFREQRGQAIADKLRPIWEKNYIANRPKITPDTHHQLRMVRKFDPALCIGAGPSLKKNIQDINPELYTIFACDKVCPRLAELKIMPDFVIALNAEKTDVSKWLEPVNCDHPTLVMPVGVHPDTYQGWFGKLVFINAITSSGIHERVAKEKKMMPMVMGSNAGTCCFLSALYQGYNPICYIGMDFSFESPAPFLPTITPENIGKDVKNGQYNFIEMTDVNGDVRWLDLGWFDMADAFQDHVKSASTLYGVEVVNATEGGINYSEYCLQATLKEFNKMVEKGWEKPNISLQARAPWDAR